MKKYEVQKCKEGSQNSRIEHLEMNISGNLHTSIYDWSLDIELTWFKRTLNAIMFYFHDQCKANMYF